MERPVRKIRWPREQRNSETNTTA